MQFQRIDSAMRNLLLLLFFSWCCASALPAQMPAFVILDTNTSDGATYSQEGGNERRVFGGMALKAPGRLRLMAGARATVVFEARRIELEGPAMYDLERLAEEIRNQNSATFLDRFWAFISNAIKDTETPDKVERYHRRYLSNARAGVSGFGSQSYAIKSPLYLSGRLTAPGVRFHWDSVAGATGYVFELWEMGAGQPILSACTRNEQLTLSLEELNLPTSQLAFWKVRTIGADSTAQHSRQHRFRYAPAALEAFEAELEADGDYQSMTEAERVLYRLYELEEEGFFQAARQAYAQLVQQHPRSELYTHLYTGFLVRMNALEEAKNQMR